jgi:hypothetical protein
MVSLPTAVEQWRGNSAATPEARRKHRGGGIYVYVHLDKALIAAADQVAGATLKLMRG